MKMKKCVNCQKDIICLPHDVASRRYCSRACYWNYKAGRTWEEIYGKESADLMRDKMTSRLKGVPKTALHRMKIREALNRPEVKERFSLMRKGHLVSEETRRKIGISNHISLTGTHHPSPSLETRQKISAKRLLQRLPSKDTFIELRLDDAMRELGLKSMCHVPIDNFVQCDRFAEPNIVLFADGCYWHGCPVCYPDRSKLDSIQNKGVIRDALVNEFFRRDGNYQVLRFWEHDIKNNFDDVKRRIALAIGGRLLVKT